MNREIIIAKVIQKLSSDKNPLDISLIRFYIKRLEKIYDKYKKKPFEDQSLSKDILKFMEDLTEKHMLDEKTKLIFLREAKKNKLFDFSKNKHLERAWRTVLKNWDLRRYRLEGGI